MEFDNIHQMPEINEYWNQFNFRSESGRKHRPFLLSGPRGCGKTRLAREYVQAHSNARYFSFRYLSNEQALAAFAEDFLADKKTPQTWQEACLRFAADQGKRFLFIFLDDLDSFENAKEVGTVWSEIIEGNAHIATAQLQQGEHHSFLDGLEMGYRTIADFCKALPDYDRASVVRLYALTGGIPAVAHEIDERKTYGENLEQLLAYDSAFSTTLPRWMRESFRTPESYYPILDSIARGHHRVSEIAKEIGFAGNKCKTYLDALCKADFVAVKDSRYYLKNNYYKAWCLYVYEGRRLQIKDPGALIAKVNATLDSELAMPAFRESCFQYMMNAEKDFLFEGRYGKLERDVVVSLPGKEKVILDFCLMQQYCSVIGVCPESLDAHITKTAAQKIISAVSKYCTLYNTDVVLFSVGRFSDWCVHKAAKTQWLHEVTAERLKFSATDQDKLPRSARRDFFG